MFLRKRPRIISRVSIPLLLCRAVGLSACNTASPPAFSGFLDYYDGMLPDPGDKSLLWWQRAGFDEKLGIPTQVHAGFTSLGHARQAGEDWVGELFIALKTNP